jgi:hypothetical protein
LYVPVFGVVHGAAVVHEADTFNQAGLDARVNADALPPPEIAITCGCGFGSPAEYLKVKAVGVAETTTSPPAAVVTNIVTLMVCVPEPDVTVIDPRHSDPASSPVGSTDTAIVVPVGTALKLPVGESVSHVVLEQLSSDV